MGFISTIFSLAAHLSGLSDDNKDEKQIRYSQIGWAATAFSNIIYAHSSPEGIVEEFSLDEEGCIYTIPWFGQNAYEQAYQEAMEQAMIEAEELTTIFEEPIIAEDLLDDNEVEENAYEYALEYAEELAAGNTWIPIEMLDWAFYELSDHNQ